MASANSCCNWLAVDGLALRSDSKECFIDMVGARSWESFGKDSEGAGMRYLKNSMVTG